MSKQYDFSDFDEPTKEEAPASSEYDFSDFDEPIAETESTLPELGRAEAAAVSFGQGSGLGLTPIISGLTGAGMELADDARDMFGEATGIPTTVDAQLRNKGFEVEDDYKGLEGLMKSYYDARDNQKNYQAAAQEQYPVQSIAANIVGSIPTTIATAGLGQTGTAGNALSKILPQADKFTKATTLGTKIAAGAREGAKAGALVGFGDGDAKLAEGEIYDTFRDTADSALGGAVVGGAFPVAGKALSKGADLVTDLPIVSQLKTAFKGGQAGIKLNEKSAGDAIKSYSEDLLGEIQSQFRKAGLTKASALDYADEVGVRVQAGEAFQDVMDDIVSRGASSTADRTEKEALLRTFKELKEGAPNKMQDKLDLNAAKMQQKMEAKGYDLLDSNTTENNVADFIPGTENVKPLALQSQKYQKIAEEAAEEAGDAAEKVVSQPVTKLIQQAGEELPIEINKYDLDNLTLRQVDEVMGEINRHTGDLSGPARTNSEKTARALAAKLKILREDALENAGKMQQAPGTNIMGNSQLSPGAPVSSGNAALSKTFSALDRAGIDDNVLTGSQVRKDAMVDKLRNTVTAGNPINRERMFQYLEEASPEGYKGFKEGADFLNEFNDLSKSVKPLNSSNIQGIFGSAKNIGLTVANKTGGGYQTLKDLVALPVEKLGQIAQKFGMSQNQASQQYSSVLMKAAKADERQRSTILYGLYQQPAFKELYQKLGEDMNDTILPVGTDREQKN